jgi:hypothetical protein
MTATLAATAVPPTSSGFERIWRIVRLHLITPSVFVGIPWIIIGGAWLISITIALIIQGAGGADAGDGMRYSWAVISPQWYLVVVGVQAIGLTFQFALGFGTTRRDFWLGTSLLFGLVAFFNATAFAILVQLEKATDGWWVGAHMFDALWYGIDGPLVDFFSTFALQLFVFFIGASATTVYMRWRIPGMLVIAAGAAVLLLGSLALITFTESWPAVFAWFAAQGVAGVFGWMLLVTAVFAVAGFLVIRRATPRT